jgi:hypothetical protein
MAATSKSKSRKSEKKYFTVEEANKALPLLRVVTTLAGDLRERQQRLTGLMDTGAPSPAHQEELEGMRAEFERGQEQMRAYQEELAKLHVELKDFFTGLVDFPAQRDGREVYLCWRLGEAEVAHWHELDAGFSGRQSL